MSMKQYIDDEINDYRSTNHRINHLPKRERGRGNNSQKTINPLRGRGARGRARGRSAYTNSNNNNNHTVNSLPTRGRGRGRGRGSGNSQNNNSKNRKNNNTNDASQSTNTYKKRRQKNQVVQSRGSRFTDGHEIREWQKLPSQILREWCQQHKRKKPIFKKARIDVKDLELFCKKYGFSMSDAASKAHRCRIVLPDSKKKEKDLTFCSKEVYKTQKHSQHMTALLALNSLCPSLPLERKLPDAYSPIWSAFGTEQQTVHTTSIYKSKKERELHLNDKNAKRKQRERQREQYEYERFADLTRVHMNEELRNHIQQVLRREYVQMHLENKDKKLTSLFSSLQTFVDDEKGIKEKMKQIENAMGKNDKRRKFLEKLSGKLLSTGFKKEDCKKASYLTAGIDFMNNEDLINDFIENTEDQILDNGTRVVKKYKSNSLKMNVDKYAEDAVTWLCLHLDEKALPSKYAAKGKQFEVHVVNQNALGFTDKDTPNIIHDEDADIDLKGIDTATYYWLVQFGFPKKMIVHYIREENAQCHKYVILGKLYKKLIELIGSDELKSSLNVEVNEELLTECDDLINSELESLSFMFEDINVCEIEMNDEGDNEGSSHQNVKWYKQFKFGEKKKKCGILEIHRVIKCDSFCCYPSKQIPIITFRSPNESISQEQCQQIIQCLIKEAQDCLGGEVTFSLISWIEENAISIINNSSSFECIDLSNKWERNEEEKEDPNEQIEENKQEQKEKEHIIKSKHKEKKISLFDTIFTIKKERHLKNNDDLNQSLLNKLRQKEKQNKKFQQYLKLRQALPAYKSRDKILKLMEDNQVLVISGETGCGKSTQIPQYILDHYIQTNRGSVCNIIVTQPRRISAVGLADRVSTERCQPVGDQVGYSIRLENRTSDATQLLYCTTGILLRRLMTSLKIQSVTHVIIDEVHERSVDIDFLLVILKFLVEKRSDLKLILMSATLNAELFSNYFNKCPILTIPGRTFPVMTYFLEDLLSQSRINLPKTRWCKFNQQEIRVRAKNLKEKEVYEKHNVQYNDRVFQQMAKWDEREHHQIEIGLIVDTIFHIIKTYPLPDDNAQNKQSAILVFLPGMYEITSTERAFYEQVELRQMSHSSFWVIALHSSLPTMNQKRVFQTPPSGIRKIVLSTNIAETSITINDVKFVIDTGKMKEMSFDATKEISVLAETWIAIAHADQRKGRAGRVGPGYCYKLYSLDKQSKMRPSPIPELLRSSLENVALKIKLLRTLSQSKKWLKDVTAHKKGDIGGIKSILSSCIEPPSIEQIDVSVSGLREVGCLDEKELLSPLGYHLSKLPISNVRLGKMLLYGVIFECITPILSIAAILTGKNIYRSSREQREFANAIKRKYYVSKSDHLTMFKFYALWKKSLLFYGPSGAKKFAYDNYLSHNALEQIDGICGQYRSALKEIKFIDNSYRFEQNIVQMDHPLDKNSKSHKLIKAILTAGLYPNVIKVKMPKKKYDKTLTGAAERDTDSIAIKYYLHPKFNRRDIVKENGFTQSGRVFIHGQSNLMKEQSFECQWLIYLTKIESRSKLQVYDVSMTTPYSLLFFGGNIEVDHNRGHVIVDEWIRFIAPGRIAVLVKELKKMCNLFLMKKIADPTLDVSQSEVIMAIQRLLKSDGLE